MVKKLDVMSKPITERECEVAAAWLYEEVEKHIGERKARRLFAKYGKPITRGQQMKLLLLTKVLTDGSSRSSIAEDLAKRYPSIINSRTKTSVISESLRTKVQRVLKDRKTAELFLLRREVSHLSETLTLPALLAHRGRRTIFIDKDHPDNIKKLLEQK